MNLVLFCQNFLRYLETLCELTSTFNPKTRSVWGPKLIFSLDSAKEVSVRPRVKELAEAMFQSKTPLHEQPMSLDLKDSVTRLR